MSFSYVLTSLIFFVSCCQHVIVMNSCCFFSPIFTHMAGSSSVWKALSSTVLQAAFNVDAETEKLFRSKRTGDAVFFPPPN